MCPGLRMRKGPGKKCEERMRETVRVRLLIGWSRTYAQLLLDSLTYVIATTSGYRFIL